MTPHYVTEKRPHKEKRTEDLILDFRIKKKEARKPSTDIVIQGPNRYKAISKEELRQRADEFWGKAVDRRSMNRGHHLKSE